MRENEVDFNTALKSVSWEEKKLFREEKSGRAKDVDIMKNVVIHTPPGHFSHHATAIWVHPLYIFNSLKETQVILASLLYSAKSLCFCLNTSRHRESIFFFNT